MVGVSKTLESPWPPLAIHPCSPFIGCYFSPVSIFTSGQSKMTLKIKEVANLLSFSNQLAELSLLRFKVLENLNLFTTTSTFEKLSFRRGECHGQSDHVKK
jgi:hypothetical protein